MQSFARAFMKIEKLTNANTKSKGRLIKYGHKRGAQLFVAI